MDFGMKRGMRGTGHLNWTRTAVAVLYAVMIAGALLLGIFFPHVGFGRDYLCVNYLPSEVLIPFGCVFLAGLYLLTGALPRRDDRLGRWMLIGSCALLLAFQVAAAWNYYFLTDWDVLRIIGLSDAVAHGRDLSEFSFYFSRCPNNLGISALFSGIVWIVHHLGLHSQEYFALICFQCMINTMTGALLAYALRIQIDDLRLEAFGYLLYVLLLGISPWVTIPYTDSVGLFLPILVYVIWLKRKTIRHPWLWMAFVSGFAYYIKPHTLIVLIAVLLSEALARFPRLVSRSILKKFASMAAGAVLGLAVAQIGIFSMGVEIDHNLTFDVPHFFMEGMNDYSQGDYSEEDVTYSGSFSTLSERNAANWKRAFYRIRTMGFVGFAKLMVRKTLANYYDGTFSWGAEGVFFKEVFPGNQSGFSRFLRGLYYTRDYASEGKYFTVWSNFEQMLWLSALAVSVCSVLKRPDLEFSGALLTVIGISVFELIFECRARYFYTFVPFYALLAAYGARTFSERFRPALARRRGKEAPEPAPRD